MATILTKKSDTASAVPLAADLTNAAGGAELAVNATDKRLFSKTSGGTVVELGTNPTAMAVVGNTTVGGTLGVTGATTLAGVSATTLSASSTVTLSGGTANGVAYLNGSKVVTSGSALTFDGSSLGVGVASPTQLIDGTATNPRLKLTATSTGYAASQFANSSGSSYFGRDSSAGGFFGIANGTVVYSSTNDPIGFFLGNNEQMRLTSTGLGIGTSSPARRLDVATASGNCYVGISRASKSTGQVALQLSGGTSGTDWIIYQPVNSDTLTFFGNSADRMSIDSSGNLGLGVTPSAWWSNYSALQVGLASSLVGQANDTQTHLSTNARFDGTNWVYMATSPASRYAQVDNNHWWFNAPSGTAGNAITFTQAMTLDASGRLGIGTTSPSNKLVLAQSGATSVYQQFLNNSSSNIGYIGLTSGGTYVLQTNNSMTFSTGASYTEAARIDSSGNLLVGTTSATAKFTVESSSLVARFTQTSAAGVAQFKNGSDAGYGLDFLNVAGSSVGAIYWTGTATTYATSSDYRLKNSIAPMTGALAKVAQLKPVTYKWNADGSDGEGFIAHELAEVCPHAVTGEKDAVDEDGNPKYQGIDTSFLVATLTAAIQELKAEFDAYVASHP